MYKWLLFNGALFFALVPGVIVTLPSQGSRFTIAFVHAVIFAVLHGCLAKVVKQMEFFANPDTRVDHPCPPGSNKTPSGDCRIQGGY